MPRSPAPAQTHPTLLATKVHPPQGRRRLLERGALVDRLVAGRSGRLTVVSAPAGWGKTTIVLQWCRRTAVDGTPFGWVSLDEDDSDPMTFWAYVVGALGAMFPGYTSEAQRLAGQGGLDVRARLVPALVNGLAGAPGGGVLVLDDYHAVRSPQVDDQVGFLIDHLPPTLHLAVVTRSEPALPLARLRAQGELTELHAADLRFSPGEAAALLNNVLGLRLGRDDVLTLQQRTEGWAAALHLAALHLAALSLRTGGDATAAIGGFSGEHDHLVQYLGSEVLSRLDPALRSWLTQTSVLDRFCVSLCDAVTGRTDGAEMLRRAEQANLFVIALDDRHDWLRFHHLFAEMLRRELAGAEAGHRAALNRRAAGWYAAHDLPVDAVRHALQGGDLGTAHRLAGRHWNHEYNAGRLATVDGWLTALGEERVRQDPWLSAARVLIWADEGRLDELDAWLEVDPTVDGYPYAVLRALHRFKSGDLGRAGAELARSQRLRSESEPFWPTVERCVRGTTAYWSGDLATARTSLASATTLARSYDNAAGLTYATGYLALMALDAEDVVTARRRLDQVAAHLDPRGDLATHFVLALPLLALGRLLDRDGDLDAARRAFTRAATCARGGAGRLERVATTAALARLADRLGDREQSAGLLREAAALLRLCPDAGRAAALVADEPSAPRLRPADGGRELTAREAALLRLLPSQLTLREIADELYVSHNTAKTHSRTLYRKLGVATRDQAVVAARNGGLL